jgi:hypothetical protein
MPMDKKKPTPSSLEVSLAVVVNDVDYIKTEVIEIKKLLSEKYVTLETFEPIRRIVYGMVTLVLTAVVGGMLALIINK